MANDITPSTEPESIEIDAPDDGGATTDGKGGYVSGQGTNPGTGGTTRTGTGSSS